MTRKVAMLGTDLTPSQLRALEAVSSCKTLAEAARMAKVDRSRLTAWMAEPRFRQALAAIFEARIATLHDETTRLATKGLTVLEAVLDDATNPAALRARVASDLVDTALRLHEHAALGVKVEMLEMRLEAANAGYQQNAPWRD